MRRLRFEDLALLPICGISTNNNKNNNNNNNHDDDDSDNNNDDDDSDNNDNSVNTLYSLEVYFIRLSQKGRKKQSPE